MTTLECNGTFTVSLMDANTAGQGYIVGVKNVGSGVITVALVTNTNTLDGTVNGTLTIPQLGYREFKVNAAANGYYSTDGQAAITTQTASDNTTKPASTAFVQAAITTAAPAFAAQSDQETATSTTTIVSPGRQQFHPSAAKAWVLGDTTGTRLANYGVSSLTDIGTGQIGVNFTTSFSSANYAALVTIRATNFGQECAGVNNGGTISASRCDFIFYNSSNSPVDPNAWSMAFYGDQ